MFVSVGDVRLFVDIDGAKLVPDGPVLRERPTLVLLHGGPGFDHSTYKPFFDPLTDVAQVVYYDHRGAGRSEPGPIEKWNLDQWADDVQALCDVLGIERPVVFGISFGGFVALNYALRHPDGPAGIVLAGTAAHIDFDRSLDMFERLGGAKVRAVAARYFADPTPENRVEYLEVVLPVYTKRPQDPDGLARVRPNAELSRHFFAGEVKTFDLRPQLAAIRCPILQLHGELDPIVTIDDALELADALPPESRLVRFPDAGHLLLTDEPDECRRLIREFVLDAAAAASPV